MKARHLAALIALAAPFACITIACDSGSVTSGGEASNGPSEDDPTIESDAFAPAPASYTPDLGDVVTQAKPPPPISGGTLAVGPDGNTVAISDPDRDLVYIVDVGQRAVTRTVTLAQGAEPGRVTFDLENRIHIALRGTGQLATIDLASGALTLRTACATTARGIAFDKTTSLVYIACKDGALVSFPPAPAGVEQTRRDFGADLRDIVLLKDGSMYLTHFRNALIQRVTGTTSLEEGSALPTGGSIGYRAIAAPAPQGDGQQDDPIMVSQEALAPPPTTLPDEYYAAPPGLDGCDVSDIVGSSADSSVAVVATRLSGRYGSVIVERAVVPVDLASNGREHVVIAAGNAFNKNLNQILIIPQEHLQEGQKDCVPQMEGNVAGQAIAAAFDGDDELLVQTREPAALHIMTQDRSQALKTIPLSTISRKDTGHDIFHATAGRMLACASCHAEGGDDGHTWSFGDIGPRRTPSLLGTLNGTAPFHWDGSVADVQGLSDATLRTRMAGPDLGRDQVQALQKYLFALPAPASLRPATDAAATRGATIFATSCASCHSGAMRTNNLTLDVGTNGKFQVPSLIGVAWRPPFLHDGCGMTLLGALGSCGGANHANILENLPTTSQSDIEAFLETL